MRSISSACSDFHLSPRQNVDTAWIPTPPGSPGSGRPRGTALNPPGCPTTTAGSPLWRAPSIHECLGNRARSPRAATAIRCSVWRNGAASMGRWRTPRTRRTRRVLLDDSPVARSAGHQLLFHAGAAFMWLQCDDCDVLYTYEMSSCLFVCPSVCRSRLSLHVVQVGNAPTSKAPEKVQTSQETGLSQPGEGAKHFLGDVTGPESGLIPVAF